MQADYYKAYANAANVNYDGATKDAAPPHTASESIIARLANIRANLSDLCQSMSHAADKIVGSAPTPIQQTGALQGAAKADRPPASCFMDAIQQALTDLERIGSEVQDHLGRIHRSF